VGQRWWHGGRPEWDVVARSSDGPLLLGEAKWSRKRFSLADVRSLAQALRARAQPELPSPLGSAARLFALFLPRVHSSVPAQVDGVQIVTADQLLPALYSALA
jgi:hypothetical protein